MRGSTYIRVLLPVVLIVATACEAPAQVQDAFPNLSFDHPVDIQAPDDGSNRLFVVGQEGVIWSFSNDPEATEKTTFLDITDRVRSGGERGLLGLAFHPNFATNGLFFVDYTAPSPLRTVIARYQVDPDDPTRTDPSSETILLEVEQPYGNHNAGQIVFGPDGYLYVTLGDGGSGGDPQENGQDPSTLLGSILRIDADNPSEGRAYGIPPDNPFVDNDGGWREEIYAYGLRNPWRISFGPDGRLWAADVGQNAWEEIDWIEAGGNYGWNTMEGTHCFDPRSGCDASGLERPVWEYSHSEGQSVTGGFVYTGPDPDCAALQGKYIYADYVSGRLWALSYGENGAIDNALLAPSVSRISTFGTAPDGTLYLGQHGSDGRLLKLDCTALSLGAGGGLRRAGASDGPAVRGTPDERCPASLHT